ncbi:MAG: DNA repair exonuclease [Gammaproteobacteria bacterium]
MGFRFIHTADWQIGKPFGNVPGDAGSELRAQRLRTVERIANLARERRVDAVLIAGDAFDSNEVEDRTISRTLDALRSFEGPWIFLPGNHDAALVHSVWTRLRLLRPGENVIIADRPEPVPVWGGRAVILPAPLRRRREADDQTVWFDAAPSAEGTIRIGLAHGSVAGRLPGAADSANSIPETRADSARLDYLALGDWHGALQIAPRTWYSGTPETDRHRDNRSGFIHLVEIDGPGQPARVETISTGAYGWHQLEVEVLDGTGDPAIMALESLSTEPRRSVVSLRLRGAISLAERHNLTEALADWRNRLHHLEVDDFELFEDPTADDLDALDTGGFVRLAVDRLKAKAADAADPQAAAARVALRMMYLDHMKAKE